MTFSAVILAGGKSSRMGCDKAWLEIGGQTLLARQIQLVRTFGATEIFISGRADGNYSEFGCRVLQDHFLEAGPLAGIESALRTTTTPLLLVLAVDMPALNLDFLEKLRAACTENSGSIPQVDGRLEPLVAFYPRSSGLLARRMLEEQQRGLQARTPGPTDFARKCVTEKLAVLVEITATEASCFANLNSPEDVRARRDSML